MHTFRRRARGDARGRAMAAPTVRPRTSVRGRASGGAAVLCQVALSRRPRLASEPVELLGEPGEPEPRHVGCGEARISPYFCQGAQASCGRMASR